MNSINQISSTMDQTLSDSTSSSLSAYMDGELADEDQAFVHRALKSDGAAIADWSTYHCIGDVLRSNDTAFVSSRFCSTFSARLEGEPALFSPEASNQLAARPVHAKSRWRLPVSVAAGVAAMAMVGGVVMTTRMPEGQQVAAVPSSKSAATVVTSQAQPLVAAADADVAARPISSEYLMAHRNYSTGLAIHGVVSHVRTAGYDGK